MKRTVLSFLGIMKEGDAHADAGRNSNTPRSQCLFNSMNIVSLCTLGTGNGLPWNGLMPSFNSRKTGSVFQSPSGSSKSFSNSMSYSSNLFWSWRLRWVQLALTTDWRSAFSYLASRIWTTLWVASCVLCGSWTMLLFTVQALSIFDVVRLLMSLIGKMISSIIIFICSKIQNNL